MPARTYPSNNSASLWHLVASAERVSQDSSTALSAAKGPPDEERTDSMNALMDSVAVHNRLLAVARENVPNPPAADVESFEYNIHVASTFSGVSYLRGFADGIYNWDTASAEVSRWLACIWRCLVHESPDIKLVYDCLSLFTHALRSLEKPGALSRHKFSDLSCHLRVETAVCDIYDVDEHLESHIVWIWRDLIVSSVAHDGALGATVLINNRISEYGYGKLVADRIRNPGQDLDELWDGHWSQAMIDAGQELKP